MLELKEPEADSKQHKALAFFKSLTLFANLPDQGVMHFVDASQIKTYKKGQLLYLEGEEANSFYILCSGWLKLFRTTREGEEVGLAMLTKDNITGEHAIFEQERYASSAQIVEDAQILSIPLALLREQLRLDNQLAFNMMASQVQYQRRHELQLEQYFLYSAPQRIGHFILGLCPPPGQKDIVTLSLPYDKSLIAATLGMKGATFSRALNILREETGIHITGTRVTIDSMERLLQFVNGYSHPHLYKASF